MCIKWYINWKIYEANKDKYKDPDNVKNTCAYFVAKQIGYEPRIKEFIITIIWNG